MSSNGQYDEHHNEGKAGYYRDLLMNEPGNPDHVGLPKESLRGLS